MCEGETVGGIRMQWQNLTLAVSAGQADLAEVSLWDAGAVSVTVEDAGDQPLLEPGPGETPTWDQVLITGLFEDGLELGPVASRLGQMGFKVIGIEDLGDRIWEREWMEQFKPVCFAGRLWICPTGYQVEGETVLHLDPGLAFGTGSHPTTRMCLEWLAVHSLAGQSLVDYGCGSGILAIAAKLLGAEPVLATDNDPQALTATRENAARNAVAKELVTLLPEQVTEAAMLPASIVMANILAGPLVALKPTLLSLLKADGTLVLSGILQEQAEWLIDAYQPHIKLNILQQTEEWVLLEGRYTG